MHNVVPNFKKMVFPLLNISTKKWNSEDINNYIIFDKTIYTDKESIFNELYKNKLFIDCNGQIFKAIRKEELTDKWRNWLRFIPNIWKCEIHFKTTGENWTVNQLRNYLLERISDLKPTKHTEKWKSDLMNAKNYTELIYGI